MEIFLDFYKSLFPYLLFIPFGYWIGKKQWISSSWVTKPMIYLLMPVLVINHLLEADQLKLAILPIVSFCMASAMILPAMWAYHHMPQADNPHLTKCSFSFFNVAFFGIPVVTALFGEEGVTTLICIYIGTAFYGDTIGYYQVAKSKYSTREALGKLLRIPFLYVFLLGISLKLVEVEMPKEAEPIVNLFSLIVSAGGMMIIGMNVVKVNFKEVDLTFFGKILSLRTVSAVLLMALFITLEYWLVDGLEEEDRQMLALIPLFPVAANVTVYASFLGSKEEASALLVLFSMALSLLLVPLVAMWF